MTLVEDAPPWLVSAILHMACLILLGLWVIGGQARSQLTLDATFAEELGEQLDDPTTIIDLNDVSQSDEQILAPEQLPQVENPFDPDLFNRRFHAGTR